MSLQSLARRIDVLHKALVPQPRIINCTGARDELMAQLESHMTEEQLNTPVEWTEEQKKFAEEFSAMLAEMVKEDEQKYNVRFVSYG